ncbi:MAG: cyclase family protein, partial [Thermoanaerobaculia bacterium]
MEHDRDAAHHEVPDSRSFQGPGVSTDAARWLGRQGIAAFGVETASPGVVHVSNREV